MKPLPQISQLSPWLLTALAFLLPASVSRPAQGQEPPAIDSWRDCVLPRDLAWLSTSPAADTAANRASRSWLFRMPLPQSCSNLVLDSDPDPPGDDISASASMKDQEVGRWQVVFGSDNPFLDLRRPGDPGGPGYYKLYSQMALLDTQTSGLRLGLQAVTPAGLDADGVATGPTVISPSLAWSCDVADNMCLHAFVSKNLRANSRWAGSLGHPAFGLALESSWPWGQDNSGRCPTLFVEALSRPFAPAGQRSLRYLDLLPGIHWRLSQNWWFSSGILLPMPDPRLDAGQLQITCSWQF
jgi:hypothetical protein